MKTFSNQVDLTAYFESFRAKAYKCPAGVWTIGYGETRPNGKLVTPDMVCTMGEALTWLIKSMADLDTKIQFRLSKIFSVDDEHQLDAVKDYAYNLGINAFPTLLKYLKAGDIESASEEFLNGIYANGKPLMGLLLRRISEYNTFCNGTYIAYEETDPITPGVKSLLLLKNGHNDLAVKMINRLKVKES